MSEVVERTIPGLGELRFEDYGPGEWLTKEGNPAKIQRRRYLLNGVELPSVTSITDTLPKGGLMPWYEDRGAQGAIRAMEEGKLRDVPLENVVKVVRQLKYGADAAKEEGSARGTAIHDAFEELAKTGTPPALSDYPQAWRGWVKGCARAWLKLDPEPIEAEFMVCNPAQGYAGRPDLLCMSKGERVLLDYKTGKGQIYEQAHYQTRGYVEAFPSCEIDPPDRIIIVGISDDGAVELQDCVATSEDWRILLALYRSRKRVKQEMASAKAAIKAADKAQQALAL